MTREMKDIYFFMLEGRINMGLAGLSARKTLDWFEQYRVGRGKIWCWHKWKLFQVVNGGYNYKYSSCKAICEKCGKIDFKCFGVEEDYRLINYVFETRYI